MGYFECSCIQYAKVRFEMWKLRHPWLWAFWQRTSLLLSPWFSLCFLIHNWYLEWDNGLPMRLIWQPGLVLFWIVYSPLYAYYLQGFELSTTKDGLMEEATAKEALGCIPIAILLICLSFIFFPFALLLVILRTLILIFLSFITFITGMEIECFGNYNTNCADYRYTIMDVQQHLCLCCGAAPAFIGFCCGSVFYFIVGFGAAPLIWMSNTISDDECFPITEASDETGTLTIVVKTTPTNYFIHAIYSWIFDIPLNLTNLVFLAVDNFNDPSPFGTSVDATRGAISLFLTLWSIESLQSKYFSGFENYTQGELTNRVLINA